MQCPSEIGADVDWQPQPAAGEGAGVTTGPSSSNNVPSSAPSINANVWDVIRIAFVGSAARVDATTIAIAKLNENAVRNRPLSSITIIPS